MSFTTLVEVSVFPSSAEEGKAHSATFAADRAIGRFEHQMLEGFLTFASFAFYRSMRFIMRRLIVLNSRLNKRRAHQWHVLSAEALNLPLAMPALMTSGPRWNPHAILAGAGPFAVKESVRIDTSALMSSAKSWTLVFYTFPDQKTAGHVGSPQGPFADRWHTVRLAPGKYSIALRCYRWSNTITFPEIHADGATAIPSRSVSGQNNDFYYDLSKRRGRLYLWMHYYVYNLLRGTSTIPGVSTEREFLPMGNPETEFRYGPVQRGHSLRFNVEPAVLSTHDLYFTQYSRDSFPTRWYRIEESVHTSEPATEDGFYLLRMHRQSQSAEGPVAIRIDIL